MRVFGLVNIIRGADVRPARGGGLLALLALFALLIGGAAAYQALEGALAGVRESTAAANVALAWTLGGAVLLAVLIGGAWLLIGRRREVREGTSPADARAFSAQVDRALEAHRHVLSGPAGPRGIEQGSAVQVEAVRLDRLEEGSR